MMSGRLKSKLQAVTPYLDRSPNRTGVPPQLTDEGLKKMFRVCYRFKSPRDGQEYQEMADSMLMAAKTTSPTQDYPHY